MRGRVIVTLGSCWAELAGTYGTRDLVIEVGGRPTWAPLRKAWSTSRNAGRDAADLAELRGWLVTVVDESPPTLHGRAQLPPSRTPEAQPEDVALW